MNKVQIFRVAKVPNTKSPYRVKWRVAGHDKTRAFKKQALAEKFNRELHAALERGDHFSSVTGEPDSLIQSKTTFASCAAAYVADNYNQWEPSSRRSTIQALTHSVLVLNRSKSFPYEREIMADVVRKFLLKPSQNAVPDSEKSEALKWLLNNSIPLQDLSPDILHACLTTTSKTLDGKNNVAASTLRKRKQALHATLKFGVSKKYIHKNPLDNVNFRVTLDDEAINPKSVLSPKECREIQEIIAKRGERGLITSIFIACIWLAGLRPSEVAALRPMDIHFNDSGINEIVVSRAIVEVGKSWTNDGSMSVTKQPKARRRGHSRSVPIPTELVQVLKPYIAGMAPESLIFPGPRSKDKQKPISLSAIEEAWANARTTTHTLYDLRHTNATILIYSELNVAEVAMRLGHSVAVCSRVYLGVFNSQQVRSNAKVDAFLASA